MPKRNGDFRCSNRFALTVVALVDEPGPTETSGCMKIGVLRYDIALFHQRRISVTSKPPAEIQTLIDTDINGFNTQDHDLFQSVFGKPRSSSTVLHPIAG